MGESLQDRSVAVGEGILELEVPGGLRSLSTQNSLSIKSWCRSVTFCLPCCNSRQETSEDTLRSDRILWFQIRDVTLNMNLPRIMFFLQFHIKKKEPNQKATDLFTRLLRIIETSPGILDEARLLFDLNHHHSVRCLQLVFTMAINFHTPSHLCLLLELKMVGKARPCSPNSLIQGTHWNMRNRSHFLDLFFCSNPGLVYFYNFQTIKKYFSFSCLPIDMVWGI